MPDWTEEQINAWMDQGWSAQQIIEQYAQPTPPLAPVGFGDDYSTPEQPSVNLESEPEPEVEPSPVFEPVAKDALEIEETPEAEVDPVPSEASLKRLKKAELIELAKLQGLKSSGTKADIIARLLS